MVVNTLDDLTAIIEYYKTLIGAGRYDEAFDLFDEQLYEATYELPSARHLRIELLEMLFPDGIDRPSALSQQFESSLLWTLEKVYYFGGCPGKIIPLYERENALREQKDAKQGSTISAEVLLECGKLFHAEAVARNGVLSSRTEARDNAESWDLNSLGLALAARGIGADSDTALHRALRLDHGIVQSEARDNIYLAQRALWLGETGTAHLFADRAWELANTPSFPEGFFDEDLMIAALLQGTAALGMGDIALADERLHHALTRVQSLNLIMEELPTLVALAELHRRQAQPDMARKLLNSVWEMAEHGPYPLIHADALNVLTQIEQDAGNTSAAIKAAMEAYCKAWCDGPPFAYHLGLTRAKAYLQALNAPEPSMPPFDQSKYGPMPEIEIDPPEGN